MIEWCAEIGSCHQGDKSLAFELIRQAKMAGATIAKGQLGWTREAQEKYAGNYDERRFVDEWASDLAKWCDDLGIEFMASIWSYEGLEVARSVGMKRYKIAHQIKDEDFLDALFRDGKEIIWSNPSVSKHRGNFLHVIADKEYPSYSACVVDDLRGFGYSSHHHGIADALIAVASGAQFIEKHITLYNYSGFPKDASFALTPHEFAEMVRIGNEMARLR